MRPIRQIVGELSIPTHPDFDFEEDSGTVDYVNPVLANNKLILFTNAIFELATGDLDWQKKLDILRDKRSALEYEQNSLRLKTLSENPAPSTASKNLALTEAFVLATLRGQAPEEHARYLQLSKDLNDHEREIDRIERFLKSLSKQAERIEFACKNIQTFLSYVKKEQEWSGRG
jgi:hypothetical protein